MAFLSLKETYVLTCKYLLFGEKYRVRQESKFSWRLVRRVVKPGVGVYGDEEAKNRGVYIKLFVSVHPDRIRRGSENGYGFHGAAVAIEPEGPYIFSSHAYHMASYPSHPPASTLCPPRKMI
jgi:hypothetical protein